MRIYTHVSCEMAMVYARGRGVFRILSEVSRISFMVATALTIKSQ